jgi:hypothetical protein
MKLQYLALLVFLTSCLASFMAHAQQYHMVPSGDPQSPYRIEQIVPPDTRDVPTFDEGITTLRSLEGMDPGATVQIMQNPANPTSAVLCSFPDGTIQPCDNGGTVLR